jgi:hypothetical protein
VGVRVFDCGRTLSCSALPKSWCVPWAAAELLWLDPTDWPAMPWLEVFPLWQQRRREFARKHPGSALGSPLDDAWERRVMDEHRREAPDGSASAYLGACATRIARIRARRLAVVGCLA